MAALPDATRRAVCQCRVLVERAGGAWATRSLYSTVHYNEGEFWKHYNGPAYRALKRRYDPHGRQPDLYSKVTR
jgi:hypothetical protein